MFPIECRLVVSCDDCTVSWKMGDWGASSHGCIQRSFPGAFKTGLGDLDIDKCSQSAHLIPTKSEGHFENELGKEKCRFRSNFQVPV